MKLKLYDNGTVAEVYLIGKLDSNTSAETEKLLKEQADRYQKMILDLSELEYISSAGLRTIKNLHSYMVKNGKKLAIRSVGELLMELFEMTGCAGLLSFE